jgi:hypothetical protein
MRDSRTYQGMWTRDISEGPTAEVLVRGISGAHRSTGLTMAVLRIQPEGVTFRIGWRTEAFPVPEFYNVPAQTQAGLLAMGVGAEDVTFVARALDPATTQLSLELVEITREDNPRYADTPRY